MARSGVKRGLIAALVLVVSLAGCTGILGQQQEKGGVVVISTEKFSLSDAGTGICAAKLKNTNAYNVTVTYQFKGAETQTVTVPPAANTETGWTLAGSGHNCQSPDITLITVERGGEQQPAAASPTDRETGTDTCEKQTPRFTGQQVRIDSWTFDATNTLTFDVMAVNQQVTVNEIRFTVDDTGYRETGINEQISPGDTAAIAVNTADDGPGFSSGDCVTAQTVTIVYDTTSLQDVEATGTGSLSGRVP